MEKKLFCYSTHIKEFPMELKDQLLSFSGMEHLSRGIVNVQWGSQGLLHWHVICLLIYLQCYTTHGVISCSDMHTENPEMA